MRRNSGGESDLPAIGRDGLIVIALKGGGHSQFLRFGCTVLLEDELINAPARVGDEVLPVGRPVGRLPYRGRRIDQARGAGPQIVDEKTTAQVLLGRCCFYVSRRRLCPDSGSRQKERDQGELTAESRLDRTNLHV